MNSPISEFFSRKPPPALKADKPNGKGIRSINQTERRTAHIVR
jgi:hypothetical protein